MLQNIEERENFVTKKFFFENFLAFFGFYRRDFQPRDCLLRYFQPRHFQPRYFQRRDFQPRDFLLAVFSFWRDFLPRYFLPRHFLWLPMEDAQLNSGKNGVSNINFNFELRFFV